MNENERNLLRCVCNNDIQKAKAYARIILDGIHSQKDTGFKSSLLKRLDEQTIFEVPYNLKQILIAENVSSFDMDKFLLRDNEKSVVDQVAKTYRAANDLSDCGIQYFASLMLYGESGCGKTMLARYIAHVLNIPFLYVRFSSLIVSALGGTQNNLSKVFDFARTTPCVVCLDEIDAIGMSRVDSVHDVGEMSRIVITLMQELDRLPNNVVIVGTTNRFDRLDSALIRRFNIKHEVHPLELNDVSAVCERFFKAIETRCEFHPDQNWLLNSFPTFPVPASQVINVCTEKAISLLTGSDQ